MSNYHDRPEISNSDISLLISCGFSLEKWKYQKEHRKETEAMIFGGLVHCLVLEPESMGSRYFALPKLDRRTTKGKELFEEYVMLAGHRILVDSEVFDTACACAESITKHPLFPIYFPAFAEREKEICFTHPSGAKCRSKLDSTHGAQSHSGDYLRIIPDIKTMDDASPNGCAKSVAKYGYHRQAAFYAEAALASGLATEREQIVSVICAVEKTPPYLCRFYELGIEALYAGYAQIAQPLQMLHNAATAGNYTDQEATTITRLALPKWAN